MLIKKGPVKPLSHYTDKKPNAFNVAIIGAGPKGLYGLERLLAQLKSIQSTQNVEIHLFNRSPFFGAGDIYRTDQPEYLIMNYNNGYINMWPQEDPQPIIADPLNFIDWLKKAKLQSDEMTSFAPRAMVGEYLVAGFQQLLEHCPGNVVINTFTGEVTDLVQKGDDFKIQYKSKGRKKTSGIDYQQILITTGHPRHQLGEPEKEYLNFCKICPDSEFINFIYPVDERLSGIRTKSNVLIKGLGLTFVDAVLALTEGRGGHFENNTEGEVKYIPSGKEPQQIIAYSRSGLPMFPRASDFDLPKREIFYFTKENLAAISEQDEKIDFKKLLLPLIEQEIVFAYYQVLFEKHEEELSYDEDFIQVQLKIAAFHKDHPEEEVFSFKTLIDPFPDEIQNFHQYFLNYLDHTINEAEAGLHQSPLATAVAVWRYLSPLFQKVYNFGGLTPESHELFQKDYSGHLNRIAYGPPLENMKKIQVIAKAGLLDFTFARSPEISLDKSSQQFKIQDAQGNETKANYLVDARIPKTVISRDQSELYKNMLKKGIIKEFYNSDAKTQFRPGCMHLTEEGHPVDHKEQINKQLTFYGTPTEGITFDNDSLSRTCNDFASGWAKHIIQPIQNKIQHS